MAKTVLQIAFLDELDIEHAGSSYRACYQPFILSSS
jgi:hypothetical protein